MIKEIVFATHNLHKAAEIGDLLGDVYKVRTLNDIGCKTEIPETGDTFAANAAIKSNFVSLHYQMDCFADDSGLEIEALNNEPGIYSARYSGQRDDIRNLNLVLERMKGIVNRNAKFRTVICLSKGIENIFFEGIVQGKIRDRATGNQGFGYDPVFEPEGYDITFAEMTMEQKNSISHRATAMNKLISFLKENI